MDVADLSGAFPSATREDWLKLVDGVINERLKASLRFAGRSPARTRRRR